jgi:type VI secretion system protein ImpF
VPELTPQERLQPALLDRLTDDEPDKTVEPRDSRVITKAKLRQAVLRDLAWLLNTTRLAKEAEWEAFPYARRSVLNFGLPALAGETASTLDVLDLESALREAIADFEPRINAASLHVEAHLGDSPLDQHNVISVSIRGDLWAQPVPLELLLRTELDLETGEVSIREMG